MSASHGQQQQQPFQFEPKQELQAMGAIGHSQQPPFQFEPKQVGSGEVCLPRHTSHFNVRRV